MRLREAGTISRAWASLIGFYGAAISSLLNVAAGVIASQAIYLAGLCVWYLVLAKQKWWKAVHLDTICATVLLIVLDIAWFAKTISDFHDPYGNSIRIRLEWLLVIIDLTLCLVAALNVGVAIYCAAKLKRRGDLVVGNVSIPTAPAAGVCHIGR
jgi:fucose 4-O-acetylase-like acetyltransferase